MTWPRDPTLGTLLELDGQVLVVDPESGHWVRFVVTRVRPTAEKPLGLDYSLTLQGPDGERLVGFDNAHRVGIASYDEMKARTPRVARGEERPNGGAPKVWFTSTESFAKVLSAGNRELLRIIADKAPGSLDELAALAGREVSNLSRTLKTMEAYGLVRLERGERGRIAPKVPHERIELDLPLVGPAGEGRPPA